MYISESQYIRQAQILNNRSLAILAFKVENIERVILMSRTVNCTEEIIVVSDGEKDTGKLVALWGTGKFHPSVIPGVDELQDQITKEVSARTEAVGQLQANLEAEANTRVVADQNLQDQISKEITARTDGDTVLQSSVDKEVVARTDADSNLQSSIDTEVDARTKADQSLQEKIDVLEGKNAFSNVVVNGTTIKATSQENTIELEAGTNIALTADTDSDKVTIAVTGKVASAEQSDSAIKLETARNINGVAFDGTKDITITAAGVPVGFIGLWSGSIDAIPSNWALCNGENNTPDLRDRFVLGAGNRYVVGGAGGETTHTLTADEMPAHFHSVMEYAGPSGVSGATAYNNHINANTNAASSNGTSIVGGNQAHNNMPPYYALAYIMRIA
ncbi:MAG: hypothetical protein H6Q70_1895 [Firmicutes bacterium]|nr:hypothetical protein [Bacillota bacterium]